jgi:signal recognition particle subunit SRP54
VVLEKLGDSLRQALRKIAGASYVDEALIKEIVRDIQRALIQADVNVQMALAITKELQRRSLNEPPPPGMSPREHVVRIIYEELVKTLGATREIPLQKQRILLVGLYGQGKTTTAGKLGKYFEKKGLSVGLIAADVHRPAAFDQLQQLSEQIKAGFYGNAKEKDAVKIVKEGVKALEAMDVLLVDSSGRHALEPDLIKEIESVAKALKADERLLVLDATIGQQAGPQAKAFHEAVSITGVIVTKLDGTAKGGVVLSICAEHQIPVRYIGIGERAEDLRDFIPEEFVEALLGRDDERGEAAA